MAADSFEAVEAGALTGPFPFNADGIPDSFRQWRHLTNVASAENSWRVVLDISDVTGVRRQYGEEGCTAVSSCCHRPLYSYRAMVAKYSLRHFRV